MGLLSKLFPKTKHDHRDRTVVQQATATSDNVSTNAEDDNKSLHPTQEPANNKFPDSSVRKAEAHAAAPGIVSKAKNLHEDWLEQHALKTKSIILQVDRCKIYYELPLDKVPRSSQFLVELSKKPPAERHVWLATFNINDVKNYLSDANQPCDMSTLAFRSSWEDLVRHGLLAEKMQDNKEQERVIAAMDQRSKLDEVERLKMFDAELLNYVYLQTTKDSRVRGFYVSKAGNMEKSTVLSLTAPKEFRAEVDAFRRKQGWSGLEDPDSDVDEEWCVLDENGEEYNPRFEMLHLDDEDFDVESNEDCFHGEIEDNKSIASVEKADSVIETLNPSAVTPPGVDDGKASENSRKVAVPKQNISLRRSVPKPQPAPKQEAPKRDTLKTGALQEHAQPKDDALTKHPVDKSTRLPVRLTAVKQSPSQSGFYAPPHHTGNATESLPSQPNIRTGYPRSPGPSPYLNPLHPQSGLPTRSTSSTLRSPLIPATPITSPFAPSSRLRRPGTPSHLATLQLPDYSDIPSNTTNPPSRIPNPYSRIHRMQDLQYSTSADAEPKFKTQHPYERPIRAVIEGLEKPVRQPRVPVPTEELRVAPTLRDRGSLNFARKEGEKEEE
ncbi:hypothetical protein EJ04DRAFT_584321 [Polyplosphaeria fusca]|uniref:Uncharacterized protein n=1 Tax=Polyplosphaeria fusca TaxID=682080 RepID=A0A9P4UZG4_9PLEO|nr:hypothetical protein EJ04DRAFT_584321 [Polyplosphaeria fusca]